MGPEGGMGVLARFEWTEWSTVPDIEECCPRVGFIQLVRDLFFHEQQRGRRIEHELWVVDSGPHRAGWRTPWNVWYPQGRPLAYLYDAPSRWCAFQAQVYLAVANHDNSPGEVLARFDWSYSCTVESEFTTRVRLAGMDWDVTLSQCSVEGTLGFREAEPSEEYMNLVDILH